MKPRRGIASTSSGGKNKRAAVRSALIKKKRPWDHKHKKSVRFNLFVQFTPSDEALYSNCLARCRREGFNRPIRSQGSDVRLRSLSCENISHRTQQPGFPQDISGWQSVTCLVPHSSPIQDHGMSNYKLSKDFNAAFSHSCILNVAANRSSSMKRGVQKEPKRKAKEGANSGAKRMPTPRWPCFVVPIEEEDNLPDERGSEDLSIYRDQQLRNFSVPTPNVPVNKSCGQSCDTGGLPPRTLWEQNSGRTRPIVEEQLSNSIQGLRISSDIHLPRLSSGSQELPHSNLFSGSQAHQSLTPSNTFGINMTAPVTENPTCSMNCTGLVEITDDYKLEQRHVHQNIRSDHNNPRFDSNNNSVEKELPRKKSPESSRSSVAAYSATGRVIPEPVGACRNSARCGPAQENHLSTFADTTGLAELSSVSYNAQPIHSVSCSSCHSSDPGKNDENLTLDDCFNAPDGIKIINEQYLNQICGESISKEASSEYDSTRFALAPRPLTLPESGEIDKALAIDPNSPVLSSSSRDCCRPMPEDNSNSASTTNDKTHENDEKTVNESDEITNTDENDVSETEANGLETETLYMCPILNCGIQYSTPSLLDNHLGQMHHSPCNPLSTVVNGLVSTATCRLLCPKCGEDFEEENDCLDHMLETSHARLLSPIPSLVYACPECLRFFLSSVATLRHMEDMSHKGFAFYFPDDVPSSAQPIPMPYRLMEELLGRCQRVCHTLACLDCGTGLTEHGQILKHTRLRHMVAAKCCTSVRDVFSDLLTDQACAECGQFIYRGLPSTGLAIHTECPLQGPVLAWPARTMREYILRCGIADVCVGTEFTLNCDGCRYRRRCPDSPLVLQPLCLDHEEAFGQGCEIVEGNGNGLCCGVQVYSRKSELPHRAASDIEMPVTADFEEDLLSHSFHSTADAACQLLLNSYGTSSPNMCENVPGSLSLSLTTTDGSKFHPIQEPALVGESVENQTPLSRCARRGLLLAFNRFSGMCLNTNNQTGAESVHMTNSRIQACANNKEGNVEIAMADTENDLPDTDCLTFVEDHETYKPLPNTMIDSGQSNQACPNESSNASTSDAAVLNLDRGPQQAPLSRKVFGSDASLDMHFASCLKPRFRDQGTQVAPQQILVEPQEQSIAKAHHALSTQVRTRLSRLTATKICPSKTIRIISHIKEKKSFTANGRLHGHVRHSRRRLTHLNRRTKKRKKRKHTSRPIIQYLLLPSKPSLHCIIDDSYHAKYGRTKKSIEHQYFVAESKKSAPDVKRSHLPDDKNIHMNKAESQRSQPLHESSEQDRQSVTRTLSASQKRRMRRRRNATKRSCLRYLAANKNRKQPKFQSASNKIAKGETMENEMENGDGREAQYNVIPAPSQGVPNTTESLYLCSENTALTLEDTDMTVLMGRRGKKSEGGVSKYPNRSAFSDDVNMIANVDFDSESIQFDSGSRFIIVDNFNKKKCESNGCPINSSTDNLQQSHVPAYVCESRDCQSRREVEEPFLQPSHLADLNVKACDTVASKTIANTVEGTSKAIVTTNIPSKECSLPTGISLAKIPHDDVCSDSNGYALDIPSTSREFFGGHPGSAKLDDPHKISTQNSFGESEIYFWNPHGFQLRSPYVCPKYSRHLCGQSQTKTKQNVSLDNENSKIAIVDDPLTTDDVAKSGFGDALFEFNDNDNFVAKKKCKIPLDVRNEGISNDHVDDMNDADNPNNESLPPPEVSQMPKQTTCDLNNDVTDPCSFGKPGGVLNSGVFYTSMNDENYPSAVTPSLVRETKEIFINSNDNLSASKVEVSSDTMIDARTGQGAMGSCRRVTRSAQRSSLKDQSSITTYSAPIPQERLGNRKNETKQCKKKNANLKLKKNTIFLKTKIGQAKFRSSRKSKDERHDIKNGTNSTEICKPHATRATAIKSQSTQDEKTSTPSISAEQAATFDVQCRSKTSSTLLPADSLTTGQHQRFLPQQTRSLLLSLDGPTCSRSSLLSCPSTMAATLGGAKPAVDSVATETVRTKGATTKERAGNHRLQAPKILHLVKMKRIVFADLENFMLFKSFHGQLPPSTFVWGFISARPKKPFHREKYFRKFPLYRSLKAKRCTHVSVDIGFGKDAVDVAMTLAIAKLDDRLPANIPFYIVSCDSGFQEVENQMRRGQRTIKVIAPRSHRLTSAAFL